MNQTGKLSGIWSPPAIRAHLQTYDWTLIVTVAALLALGMVFVFSASYYEGLLRVRPDGFYFLKRQLLWLVVGLTGLMTMVLVPYNQWARFSGLIFLLSLLVLLAVLIIGTQAFGSQRLLLGNSIQPSEFTKLAVILYSSHWLVSKGERIRDYNIGLIPYGLMVAVTSILLFLQPDITMALLIAMTAFALFYMASGNLRQMLVVLLAALVMIGIVVLIYPYLGERIGDFVQSLEDPVNSPGWQERNTVRAAVRGGLWGTGIGRGEMKTLWLVLPWTDAIFAVIGEETGLSGTLLTVALFGLLAYRGIRIAYTASTPFGQMVGTGITFLLTTQALLHMAVVLSLLPVTGVTLPFVSYGGSSLVLWMAATGLLINIDHRTRMERAA